MPNKPAFTMRLLMLAGVASCALAFAMAPVSYAQDAAAPEAPVSTDSDASAVPPPLAPIPAPPVLPDSALPAPTLPAPILPDAEVTAPALPEMPLESLPNLPKIPQDASDTALPPAANPMPDVPVEDTATSPDPATIPAAELPAASDTASDTASPATTEPAEPSPKLVSKPDGADRWSGSLMFDADRMAKLYDIYQQYLISESRKSKDGKSKAASGYDLDKKLSAVFSKPEEIKEEVLKFSLDSIVYYTDGDWSIWVNGERYFRDQALEGFNVAGSRLAVTDANDREVNFIWTPIAESFEKTAKRWEDKQRLDASSGPGPQIAAHERVEFDAEAQTVSILMRPNQTFVSKFMSVMEGKDTRAGATDGEAKAGKKDAAPTADPSVPASAPAGAPAADGSAPPVGIAPTGEPTLSDIKNMPAGPAKDKALANHLSNQYKNAFPGMTKAIESGSQLEQQAP